ncbi:unnamed protein product [Rotaria sp. Silwood2]|nr:unnamed protein product [Rotaria sp. Silwood2]
MTHHQVQDKSLELSESVYSFESNDDSTIVASQPCQQSHDQLLYRPFYHPSQQQWYRSPYIAQQFRQYCHNQIIRDQRTLPASKNQQ